MSNDTTPSKICKKCGQEFPATLEFFHADKTGKYGLRARCKPCHSEYQRNYRQANPEKKAKWSRDWQQANKAKLAEYLRGYRQANRDKIAKYRQENPEKNRINKSRRRARKLALPDTFTSEQWITCLEYHNFCCAVCGSQLRDLFGDVTPHADHWIAIVNPDCPGTVVENMVCLCNNCNQSKGAKDPYEWLCQEFGKYKAKITLSKIESYFEWARKRTGE
jgi:5-methylcytosine-specific restriction endonuclease McrA